jgi:NAD(P)-dependent dehydrogenase (short-subunit alcohol dehydrogenase family)
MFDLSGKSAIVTGGAGEIGAAIVEALHSQGADVMIADIDELRGLELARKLERDAGRVQFVRTDATSPEQVLTAVEATKELFGGIDVAVGGVGWTAAKPFLDEDPEYWRQILDVNLNSAVYLTHAVLPEMLAAGSGRVILISSLAGRIGRRQRALYSAAKAGIIGFAKAVALEFAENDITVNCLAPGSTDTAQMRFQGPDNVEFSFGSIPRKKFSSTWDQAWTVAFLASDEAAHITGQTISVDGGATMV